MSLDDRNADRENFSFDDEGTTGSRHPDSGIRGVILNRVEYSFREGEPPPNEVKLRVKKD